MQLHRLEGFHWVARTGGYARAARAFPYPITQPAVHQQVKKLEGELEIALFERVGKDRMQLTPAGKRLYEFVRPFFEKLPGLARSLKQGDYGGDFHVQTASLLLRHLLPAWVKRVHRRWPEIRMHLRDAADTNIEPLRSGEVDLLVDYLPEIPDDLASLQVATVRPFLVMPSSYPQAKRARPPIEALSHETFISYPPGSLHHNLQLEALARYGLTPARVISVSSADVILGFVEAGLGFSLVPSLAEHGPRGRGLAVRPLEKPKVVFPVWAVWRKDTPENPVLDAVLEMAPRG